MILTKHSTTYMANLMNLTIYYVTELKQTRTTVVIKLMAPDIML